MSYAKGAVESTAPFVVSEPVPLRVPGVIGDARLTLLRNAALLAVLAVALSPGAAHAATVSLTLGPTGPDDDLTPHAAYTAAPGETNRLTRGHVTLRGGPGDDTLEPSLRRDHLSCGTGTDTVELPESYREAEGGVVPASCERVAGQAFSGRETLVVPLLGKGARRARAAGPSCRGLLTLRADDRHGHPGPLWGRATWHRAKGKRARALSLHLTKAGRRAARHHRIAVERMGLFYGCRRRATHQDFTWRARL